MRHPVSFIATDDAQAAERFYCDVLGLSLRESTPYALVFADGDHVLRIQIVSGLRPAAFTVHGWQVTDIAAEIAQLMARGVTMRHFEELSQDAQDIWTTPDGHQIAWFTDPSGNILSLTQYA